MQEKINKPKLASKNSIKSKIKMYIKQFLFTINSIKDPKEKLIELKDCINSIKKLIDSCKISNPISKEIFDK